MNKYQTPKLLLVGASGSGKNTVQDYLVQKYGLKPLLSYTTREKRFSDENTHTFIATEEEYESIIKNEEVLAYTLYNGYHYFATKKQLEESDVYIIDADGVEYLKKYSNIPFVTFYLDVSELERINRMKNRGDSEPNIQERLECDRKAFTTDKHFYDYIIDNNGDNCSNTADRIYNLWQHKVSEYRKRNNIIQLSEQSEVIDIEREIIDKIYQIQTLMLKLDTNIEHIEIDVCDVHKDSISDSIEVLGYNYEYITQNNPSHIIKFKTITDDKSQRAYLKNITGYKNINDVRIK